MSHGREKLEGPTIPTIACVYSGIPIDMILSMLETSIEMVAGLSWDEPTQIRDHDVYVVLKGDVIEISDTPYYSKGHSLALSRADEVSGKVSPLDLVISWRDSVGSAVEECSDEGLAIIDGLGLSARHLAGAGIAAGAPTIQTSARSSRAPLAQSRFGVSTPDVRVVPTSRLETHLERISPPFRRLGKGLGSIVTTHPFYQHSSDREIGSVEMMRLIADMPSDLVDDLQTELERTGKAGSR